MTKERLRAYRHLKYETDQLREQLVQMETRMYSPKGQQFTSMPHGPGGKGRTMEDLVSVHLRLQEKYREKLFDLESEQLEIESVIDSLPSPERQVLRARYVEGLSWEDICTRVRFAWAQTHRIHASGLRMLNENSVQGEL